MKLLVIAGTATQVIPGLGLSVSVDSSRFALNGLEVADHFLELGHEVTLLTLGVNGVHAYENHENCKVFKVDSYEMLQAYVNYLATAVEYTCIISMLHLPRFEISSLWTSHDAIESCGANDLYKVSLEDGHFPQDSWLRVHDLENEQHEFVSDLFSLWDADCVANIVCLEPYTAAADGRAPNALMSDRIESLDTDTDNIGMIIFDSAGTDRYRKGEQGAYCLGKHGGNFVQKSRLLEYIVSAAGLSSSSDDIEDTDDTDHDNAVGS